MDDIRPDSVRLLWKAGYDSNSAIIYFVIGLKFVDNDTEVVYINRAMPSGDIRKYVVPGLTPSTKYQFRVRAVNAVGYGPWSKYSKVATTREAGECVTCKFMVLGRYICLPRDPLLSEFLSLRLQINLKSFLQSFKRLFIPCPAF